MLKKFINLKILAAALLLTTATIFVAGFANGNEQRIEGSWKSTVTAVNPPIGSFGSLITFEDKGTVIESRRLYVPQTPLGSLLETTGHGAWIKTGARTYKAQFTFLLQGAPDNPTSAGQPLGTDNVTLNLELSEDGKTLSGTFVSQPKDEAGNVIVTVNGTYSGTRMTVE